MKIRPTYYKRKQFNILMNKGRYFIRDCMYSTHYHYCHKYIEFIRYTHIAKYQRISHSLT